MWKIIDFERIKAFYRANIAMLRSLNFWLILGFTLGVISFGIYNRAIANPYTHPNLSQFDPDIYPVINVIHTPPVLLRSDETIRLNFVLVCGYIQSIEDSCHPDATLFLERGVPGTTTEIALKEEFHDTLRVLTTEIPATDPKGETFRYYLQVSEQNTGINIRFPLSGAIEPSVFPNFQLIRLAEATPTSAEVLINIPWGEKSDEIGLEGRLEQAIVGADSFDIAADGTIALLDHVNGRMVLLSPPYLTFRSYPLALKGVGDVDIDESGKIAILDLVGEPTESSGVRVPQLYILRPTQGVEVVAPVFAQRPVGFTEGIKVIDGTDTITPIDASGRILSREEQRDSRSRPQLLIQWLTDFQTRLADPGMSLAIEIQSDHPLGAVAHFSRFNQGYVVVFEWHDFQLVWFDENGLVLKNIEVLNNRYSVFNPKGRVSVDQTGTVYILGSTPLGLEIYRIKGPEEVTR